LLLCLEFFDAAQGIDEFHFPGKKRVAFVADFDMNFLQRCAGSECVTTDASDFGITVHFRMYIWFHNFCY